MAPFDPYHIWLGIPETARSISKYRLLAIDDFESDRDVISTAAERQTVFLRTLQAGEHAVLVAELLNEVSQARVTLLNKDQKAAYDEELRKQQTPEPQPEPMPPPIPVVQTPIPPPTPVVVGGTVMQEFPVSVVQLAKKPRRRKRKEIWKQPAVIGVSLVGVIGVFVLFISMMSSGDAEPVASNLPPLAAFPTIPTPEPQPSTIPPLAIAPFDTDQAKAHQAAWAKHLGTQVEVTNSIGMKLKLIPPGQFLMGSPEDEIGRGSDEHQHHVTITKPFYMQTTEVTQGQWMHLMGTEPWKGKQYGKEGPDYVATFVSWNDAVTYSKKLGEKEGRTYGLPTEAEWEYACRAGTETAWCFGNDKKVLVDYAWSRENAYDIDEKFAHQVGLKRPNTWGLYDMHGNVFEWCHDYYNEDYYKQSPEKDPRGPAGGSRRVLRGGSWGVGASGSRSFYRGKWSDGRNFFGFRLVRELD